MRHQTYDTSCPAGSSLRTQSAHREVTPSYSPISKDPRRSYLAASPPSVRQQTLLEVPKPALSPISSIRLVLLLMHATAHVHPL